MERDVATEQRRETQRQQKSRVTDDNARSARRRRSSPTPLTKFESQLKKAESTDSGPAKVAARTGDKKPTKAPRGQTHREVRAITRDYLKAAKRQINAASGTAKVRRRRRSRRSKL